MLRFEDRSIHPGARFGYRLGVLRDGVESWLGETWIDVPAAATLALRGPRPNPSSAGLRIDFSLPSRDPARLDVLDIGGRRVLERDVGSLGIGDHSVRLNGPGELDPGVYLVQLRQGRETLTVKAVLIR